MHTRCGGDATGVATTQQVDSSPGDNAVPSVAWLQWHRSCTLVAREGRETETVDHGNKYQS